MQDDLDETRIGYESKEMRKSGFPTIDVRMFIKVAPHLGAVLVGL